MQSCCIIILFIQLKRSRYMIRMSTFKRGGVHPHDKKELSKNSPMEILPVPETLVVPMSQHIGAPAKVLKKKGDSVMKGEIIGQASSFVSANVHSPVSGSVADVKNIRLANCASCEAVVIKADEIQPEMFTTRYDWKNESPQALLDTIRDMGIVGMGGATFPTHVKLAVPEGKKVDALIINGVECEPYLTSDYRSMLERADETLEGVMILAKILSPSRIIIGIEANKLDAVSLLQERIAKYSYPVEVLALKMKYPQGDEKQLIKAAVGREVPSGKLPIDVGAVVCNIGSVYAVYEACVFHKPLIERIVTVSGEAVNRPKNLLCPVGARTSDLIAYCGGYNCEEPDKLISGGPMMGFAFADEEAPVLKGTSGILALKAEVVSEGVCVSCGKCVAHCPMGLMPNRMFRNIKNGRYKEALDLGLLDCKECGCCAFICPAHLPLVQGFKLGKKMSRRK